MTANSKLKRKKKIKSWSRKFQNLRFACWNCWSYSNERHAYCKSLGYDVLALTELHNRQNNSNFTSELWIPSAQAEVDEQGKSKDPAAGVAILLSRRMKRYIDNAGYVGTRIAWVRIRGPICPIFFIAVYVPHKYRTAPTATETLAKLDALIKTVPINDCLVICGDYNCQLRRNVEGLTGKWSMTKKNETKGHDQELLDLMRKYELFAIDTKFKPKAKLWPNQTRKRLCNATYMPKHKGRRPTKLDYFLVSQRWKGMATAVKTKWGTSQHLFGTKFDHCLLSLEWAWRVRVSKSSPKPDFERMTHEMWQEFDARLEERLRQLPQAVETSAQAMGDHYDRMTDCVRATIKEVVPPKQPRKYNGRTVSEKTKRLYDLRVRDFASGRNITKSDRAAWNKTLSKAAMNDYKQWVENIVEEIEIADKRGDTRAVHQGARALSGRTTNFQSPQPTKKRNGEMIQSAEELGELWQNFLAGKFAATELEAAREEWKPLEQGKDDSDTLTYKEFQKAVKHMKKNKSTGPDGIPAEVWKGSSLANKELFFFLQHVWEQECIPKTLVLCVFVMIFKNKGSRDEPDKYRAIGLLNHAYKILSVCLLNRMVSETDWFLSEWQAGFRGARGCRDNVLLLRVIYDQFVKGNKKCVVTFIDFAAAFDSVSHRFLDHALKKAKASRKTRAMFREIYKAAAGAARIKGPDGQFTFSKTFNIERGVVQGDIISPIFFIIALDQLVQHYDKSGQGISVGHIKSLRVLGYADDAAMCEITVEGMTKRLTEFADAALKEADMKVKLAKTLSQHIQQQEKVARATDEEIMKKTATYKYECEYAKAGCKERFKTRTGMKIHCCACNFNYGLTEKTWEVEEILAVFGKADRKLFLVKWTNHPGEDSWQKEDSLIQDGCAESIKDFWDKSGINPALEYYPDPDNEPGTRCWMCGFKSTANNKKLGLKTHIRRRKHEWKKRRAHLTERQDIKKDKMKIAQEKLPKVKWGDEDVDNCWQFPYLGSIFQADGDQMPDIRARCAMAKSRAGTLRHIWATGLSLDLKLRLYIACCCSIMVWGSEAWILDEEARKCINGANAFMLSHITGKTKKEEATQATTTFNIIAWIRARRLRWVGHILRLPDTRLIKQTLKVIFDNQQDGDILMDVEEDDWEQMQRAARMDDKKLWRTRVNKIRLLAK